MIDVRLRKAPRGPWQDFCHRIAVGMVFMAFMLAAGAVWPAAVGSLSVMIHGIGLAPIRAEHPISAMCNPTMTGEV